MSRLLNMLTDTKLKIQRARNHHKTPFMQVRFFLWAWLTRSQKKLQLHEMYKIWNLGNMGFIICEFNSKQTIQCTCYSRSLFHRLILKCIGKEDLNFHRTIVERKIYLHTRYKHIRFFAHCIFVILAASVQSGVKFFAALFSSLTLESCLHY